MDDKELNFPELICKEQNLPFITFPVPGQANTQTNDGANTVNTDISGNQSNNNGHGNELASGTPSQGVMDAANQAQIYQDSSMLYHFRETQRKQVEFIKKRVLLLEKALTREYQKVYFVSSNCIWKQLNVFCLLV